MSNIVNCSYCFLNERFIDILQLVQDYNEWFAEKQHRKSKIIDLIRIICKNSRSECNGQKPGNGLIPF
jgi:hypothetical protein